MASEVKGDSFAGSVQERMPYYLKRIQLFEQYAAKQRARIEEARQSNQEITLTLPDGKQRKAIKNVTTPQEVAKDISPGLAKKVVVAEVDGQPWDLARPLEADCAIKLYGFDDPEGRDAFWHSSAHVLGQALELEFGADLTIGPALEEGFYYDCFLGDKTLTEADRARIEKRVEQAVKEGQKFERVEVTRDEALAMFLENKFKVEIITALPKEAVITVYRVGPMVDLCTGPHLPSTSYLKACAVTNMSRAFWRADVKREGLQRVYGITFPDNKQLKEYQHRIEEAKKRDHRNVGVQQELFFFHGLSPGSCFFQPNGARIYNQLVNYIKEKYWEYEYEEVISPNIYNFDLWETSGHAAHYRENMFQIEIEKQLFGLKPMNCPGHCVMFKSRTRSYRELPMRYADFGVLHRNEYSGALSGLTRVRRFQQDDAHIFCRQDQVQSEVQGFLKMLDEVYGTFGLDYSIALSTRPESYLGELEVWNKAETALSDALNAMGRPWTLNEADGAFYGPKIDITVYDALRRKFQCATVQLDFQLPIRFDLEYVTEDKPARPVIVHRAILGSVERMFAILTEHYAGKWPFWLNPRQVMIVPISEAAYEYARELRQAIRKGGIHVDADCTDKKMQKKVRESQLAQYNYILVVGEAEKEAHTVNVRTRDNAVHGMFQLSELMAILADELHSRSLTSKFEGKSKSGQGQPAAEAS